LPRALFDRILHGTGPDIKPDSCSRHNNLSS
jgi:hypothetical protein